MASRLLFDLGATTDQSGKATIGGGAGQAQPATTPCEGVLVASLASGTGTWAVEIVRSQGASGTLIGTGQGASISQGFLLLPGEQVQATVTGAQTGIGVTGSVLGTQNLDPTQLPPIYASGLQSNAVDATLSGPVAVTGNVPVQNASGTQLAVVQSPQTGPGLTVAPGQHLTDNRPIPPGANAVSVTATGNGTDTVSFYVRSIPSAVIPVDESDVVAVSSPNGPTPAFWGSLGYAQGGDTAPAIDPLCYLDVTCPPTNSGLVQVNVAFLPAGQVVVSEIINTPNNPVQVNSVNQPFEMTAGPTQFSPTQSATLTLSVPSGKTTLFLTHFYVELTASGGAVSSSVEIQLLTGGSPLYQFHMNANLAEGAVDRFPMPPGISFSNTSSFTIQDASGVLPANLFCTLFLGGYAV